MILNVNFDRSYADYAKICVSSYIFNSNTDFELVVFSSVDRETNISFINFVNNCGVACAAFEPNVSLNDGTNSSRFPPVIHARFFAGKHFPNKNILYVDTDTLCIGDLTSLQFLNEGIYMVRDQIHENRTKDTPYYNSGVILYSSTQKNCDLFHSCFEYTKENRTKYPDQDAINTIARSEINAIDPVFNYMKNEKAINPVSILHFAHSKPWETWCRNDNRHHFEQWASRVNLPYIMCPSSTKNKFKYILNSIGVKI